MSKINPSVLRVLRCNSGSQPFCHRNTPFFNNLVFPCHPSMLFSRVSTIIFPRLSVLMLVSAENPFSHKQAVENCRSKPLLTSESILSYPDCIRSHFFKFQSLFRSFCHFSSQHQIQLGVQNFLYTEFLDT